MNLDAFTPISALIGGALIGLATGLALLFNGKIAGISGVVGRILRPKPGDVAWRVWFVLGMVAGGAGTFLASPRGASIDLGRAGWPTLILGALLVGFGSRLGGGCTSGHGVCGISRGSRASIVATVTFMIVGMLVASLRGHFAGGGS